MKLLKHQINIQTMLGVVKSGTSSGNEQFLKIILEQNFDTMRSINPDDFIILEHENIILLAFLPQTTGIRKGGNQTWYDVPWYVASSK